MVLNRAEHGRIFRKGANIMARDMNRREAMALGLASAFALSMPARAAGKAAAGGAVPTMVQMHDARLPGRLEGQVTDAQSRWCGGVPDQWGIHYCHTAAELLRDCAASYYHPQSAHHASPALLEQMKLLAGFLTRCQNAEGNIDLFATNFNSPPDTGFAVHHVGTAAKLAQMKLHMTSRIAFKFIHGVLSARGPERAAFCGVGR